MFEPFRGVLSRKDRRSTRMAGRSPAPRRCRRPGLEVLESRTVPTVALNNGQLIVAADAASNFFAIGLSDSGAVDVTLNAQQYHFNPGTVSSISVDGAGASDQLIVGDTNTITGQTYTLTGMTVGRSGAQPITYANVGNLALYAGNFGNLVYAEGTAAGTPTTVYTGAGNDDTVYVESSQSDAASLNTFAAPLAVHEQGANGKLFVTDEGSTASQTYTLTATSMSRGVFYLGYDGFQYVGLLTAAAASTVHWEGTAAGATTLVNTRDSAPFGDQFHNTIDYGDASNTLDGFLGESDLADLPGDTLNVFDQGSTAPHAYVLAAAPTNFPVSGYSFSRDGRAFYYSEFAAALNFYGGSGVNTFDWQAAAVGTTTTVYTGTGANVINVGDAANALSFFGAPAYLVGAGGNNTLSVSDQGDSVGRTYVLTGSTIASDASTILTYGGVQALNFYGGSGGNVVDAEGTAAGALTTVYAGAGNDAVVVETPNATLDGFPGPLVVRGGGGTSVIEVDDPNDTAAHTYTLTGTSMARDGFSLDYSGFAYSFLNTSFAADTIDWQGTAAGTTTTVETDNISGNTVNLGDANDTLDSFLGTPRLEYGGNIAVNVCDRGSTAAHAYALAPGPFTGGGSLARDGLRFDYFVGTGPGVTGALTLNLYGGSGGNVIDWQGTAAGTTTTVYTGTGANTIDLGDVNNTLAGFASTANVVGQGSANVLNVSDQANAAQQLYEINGSLGIGFTGGGVFAGSDLAACTYSGVQALNFYAGSGADSAYVFGTVAGTATSIYAGAGNDFVEVGGGPNENVLDTFAAPLAVHGAGGNNQLDVFDGGLGVGHTYTLTADSLSRGAVSLGYDGFQFVLFQLESPANTVDWQGTAAGATAFVNTLTGTDTINFGDADNTLDGFLGAAVVQGVGNTVNVFDQGSTAAHAYALAVNSVLRDGLAVFRYGRPQSLSFYGGSGGNTIDWQYASAPTTVYTGTGANAINVGDAGNTLDSFVAPLVLVGQGSNNAVSIDDQGSTTANTYTVTAATVARNTGFSFAYSGVQSLTLNAGSGGNYIRLEGTAAGVTTTVNAGAGGDVVLAAGPGHTSMKVRVFTLDPLAGPVVVNGRGGNTTLEIIDDASNIAHTYVVTGSSVTRDGSVSISYAGLNALDFGDGAGGNTIDWQGSAAGTAMNLYADGPNDTFNVGSAGGTLDSFLGTQTLSGYGSGDILNVFDQGSTASHAYAITGTAFSRDGFTLAYSAVQAVNLAFGTGANTVNWQATNSAATTYTADFSGGSNQVSGSYSAAATAVNAAVVMTGSPPALGALTVTGQGLLDLSQVPGAASASSINNQGTIVGGDVTYLADSGDLQSGNLSLVVGSAFNLVTVGGTATLSGSLALTLLPGYVPPAGSQYDIVRDTGNPPINGTFTGLPDGSYVEVNGSDAQNRPFTATFRINYVASDPLGSDVVLTAVGAPQVSADSASVSVVVGQAATNTGTWSQPGFAGADTITASVGTVTQTGSGGSGTWSWSYPTNGTGQSQTVTITASDGRGDTATTTFALTVNRDATTTAVAPSANPSALGSPVTFTATVGANAPGGGTPTGTVTFLDGATTLGTRTLSGGTATFTTSALALGSHTITASYGGDGNYTAGTSATLTQTVKIGTTTAVASSVNPSVFGQTVTFTATVTPASGTATPTGIVTYFDGTAALGTGTLSNGKATFSTSALAAAGHAITAGYGGDGTFMVSTSPALTQTVNMDASKTAITLSANSAVYSQGVTFTATVTAASPGAGTPTGTVTFLDDTTVLGTANLSGDSATFTTTTLAVGSHSIAASYGGDNGFAASAFSSKALAVKADGSTTTLTSSADPSTFGQSVTFTATVTANSPGGGVPGGTVTFKDGKTTLGTATLNASGVATFTTSSLSAGSHAITAAYGGSANYKTGTPAALTQTVNPAAAATPGSVSAPLAFGSGMPLAPAAQAASLASAPLASGQTVSADRPHGSPSPDSWYGLPGRAAFAAPGTPGLPAVSGTVRPPKRGAGDANQPGGAVLDHLFAAFGTDP
jgi:hypothetical protein